MSDNWVVIHSSYDRYEVEVLRGLLETKGINSVIVTRQASMYTSLNMSEEVNLKVDIEDVIRAKRILSSENRE